MINLAKNGGFVIRLIKPPFFCKSVNYVSFLIALQRQEKSHAQLHLSTLFTDFIANCKEKSSFLLNFAGYFQI